MRTSFIVSPFEDLYSGLGFYPVVAKLTVYGHACNAAAIKQDGRSAMTMALR
jgi:hypothetical protein